MYETETTHEIEVTPDMLREIAIQMERKEKHENYQSGQVIRTKLNDLFTFVYCPTKAIEVKNE